jgi:hypothetical protein
MIEKHKHKLLRTGTQDFGDKHDDLNEVWRARGGPIKEEDDSLDNRD